MRARARRWGNSTAVRIPKAVADELRIEPGSELEMSVGDGVLCLAPVRPRRYSLPDLLAGITQENLPAAEWDTGPAVGKETW